MITAPKKTPRTPIRTGRKPVTLTPWRSFVEELNDLSIAEVSALIRIAEDTVRRDVRLGNLKAENYGTEERPLYRIFRECVDAWREARVVRPIRQDRK